MLQEIESFYREIGERIKIQRIKSKISQEDLAEHLGLTRTSVVNFERGRHRPSLYQLIQIANLLALDFTKLIPFTYEKPKTDNRSIDIDKIVIDQKKLDASTKKAVLGFISDINKE